MVTLTVLTSIPHNISCSIALSPQEMRKQLITYGSFLYYLECERRRSALNVVFALREEKEV